MDVVFLSYNFIPEPSLTIIEDVYNLAALNGPGVSHELVQSLGLGGTMVAGCLALCWYVRKRMDARLQALRDSIDYVIRSETERLDRIEQQEQAEVETKAARLADRLLASKKGQQEKKDDDEEDDPERTAAPGHECVVCKDRPRSMVLRSCNHLCLCIKCYAYMLVLSRGLLRCPLCRVLQQHQQQQQHQHQQQQ